MKKLLYFFVGCVVVGLIISSVFSFLPVLPYLGKGFLTTIEQRKYNQAYVVMASEFKKKVDLAQFTQMAKNSSLAQYKDVNWTKTVMDKKAGTGYVVGVITTKQNAKVMIQINFIIEKSENWQDQGWRIKGLQFEEPPKNPVYRH